VNAIRLTASRVAAAMNGRIVGGEGDREFSGVSIDTRTLKAGELFIAIRGERFDGAAFVEQAIAAGAAGLVVRLKADATAASGVGHLNAASGSSRTSPVVIAVEDTTVALQSLARAIRRESGTKVVAITGSAGKTTTKEITSEFLAARYRVIRNRGNLNNHIGLPLSLIELAQRPEIAVVELGMNHAGEIRTLVGVAEPDVRVWTNVGEAHLGFFASTDAIADAKAEIFEGASASTVLVANADDPLIADRLPRFAGRTVTFGIDRDADVRATEVADLGIDGTRARVTTPHGDIVIETPLVGRMNLANVLAATAVAMQFDIPLATIAGRAHALRPASHRGEVVKLASGITIIDDSYNANPTATKHAIDVLARAPAARRIAILGEMLELGDRSTTLHEDVGRAAARARVDILLAVGGAPAAAMADAAVAAGLPRAVVTHVATSDEAAERALALVRAGDLVLIKGSRGVKTDRVVERLKAERG
jgi:UDP-N-acetylmuramoyl-tripeptide--D-alanyl-D-alanine ligase